MTTARWRSGMLIGVGAAAGATVTALVLSGVGGGVVSAGSPDADPSPTQDARGTDISPLGFTVPEAAERELPAFASCEELRSWYVDATLPDVTPYGLGGPVYYGQPMSGGVVLHRDSMAAVPEAGAPTSGKAVGSSETGTNVQEAGVDEPDIAKTDGELVVRVRGDRVVVVDVSGDQPRVLSSVALPERTYDAELMLDGDRVLVFANEGSNYGGYYPGPLEGDVIMPRTTFAPVQASGSTRLLTLDISDPADAEVLSSDRIDGVLVSARRYADGTVRAVVSTGYPPLDFVQPNRDRTPHEAKLENQQIVREATIDQWLPQVRDENGTDTPLLECGDVRHPKVDSGFGTISVLTLPDGDMAQRSTTGVTAAGSLVYSSTDRLYVATTESTSGDDACCATSTQINAFAVDGEETGYVAAGSVEGVVKDRWSLDEYDGHLRVATSLGSEWQPREHAVTVLEEDDGRLTKVGSVAGMGRDEELKSVRWFGDLAVLVTFRQVDPLYTVDLSSPTDPEVVGSLKIPGFSSYLHPVGDGRLLGVGTSATMSGVTNGAQAATYDISDPREVTQEDLFGFGAQTDPLVAQDPRAFTYLPEQRLALVAVHDWRAGPARLVALHVGSDGTLTESGRWSVSDRFWDSAVRTLPLDDGRVAVVGEGIRVISLD